MNKPLFINQETPILLKDKKDVVKVVLYIKMLIEGINPFENDLDILSELFIFGGYNGEEEKKEFYSKIIAKGLRKSQDSLNNKITELVTKGVLNRYKKNSVKFNEAFLPTLDYPPSQIGLITKITHAISE